jgi:hypothetical protein
VIEDPTIGIDIPPANDRLGLTVVERYAPERERPALPQYRRPYHSQSTPHDPGSGGASTTGNMTIVGPDTLTVQKTGPSHAHGTPAAFTLNLRSPSSGGESGITDRLAWSTGNVQHLEQRIRPDLQGTGRPSSPLVSHPMS